MSNETDRISANPALVKRLNESRQQIVEGKGVKILLEDINIKKSLKTKERKYSPEFSAKMKLSEEDIKAGRVTKIEPVDIWKMV